MANQEGEHILIILLTFMVTCHHVYVTDGSINFIIKQPNVTISNGGFNSINISWEAEESAEKGNFTVCYYLSFRYLDKENEQILTTTSNYHTIKLRMHPRVIGSVTNALCDGYDIHFQSKPTKFVYNAPPVYINNVSCVLFDKTNLNCSWDFRTDAPDDINYSCALRSNFKWLLCTNYIKRHQKNIGCSMKDVYSDYKDDSLLNKIRIRFFSALYNFSKTFRTEAVEILTPPRHIKVFSENGNTIIKWLPPASVASTGLQDGITPTYNPKEEHNFIYEIRVVENKSKVLFRETNDTDKGEQIFTDLAKDKKYYIQIRARHRHRVSKFWGEWSKPVFINEDNNIFPAWIFIVILPALFAALAFYLCKRYMKKLLITPIPHPSQNIKTWLYMDRSNDIRLQTNIATQNEQSVPLTEIEIVTTA
ncbi:interleukin-5 receptor subunit alpha-like [Anomaloglossus baeobatrachus]|uniref:interleukin-5 receptor subunit alpha-like n=1 Tax=Anomaloglossus baeobatrachus TaxID=238106 RepID=UPI003F5095AC